LVNFASAGGKGCSEGLGLELFQGHEFNDPVSRQERKLAVVAQRRKDKEFALSEAEEEVSMSLKSAL
jgi:hypothetical protein